MNYYFFTKFIALFRLFIVESPLIYDQVTVVLMLGLTSGVVSSINFCPSREERNASVNVSPLSASIYFVEASFIRQALIIIWNHFVSVWFCYRFFKFRIAKFVVTGFNTQFRWKKCVQTSERMSWIRLWRVIILTSCFCKKILVLWSANSTKKYFLL